MKKILSLVIVVAAAMVANAQGTYGTFDPWTGNSDSSSGAHTAGTVFDASSGGIKCVGSAYQGEYYIGAAGALESALTPVGGINPFQGSTQNSLFAGYYNGDASGSVSATGFAPGATIEVQLRAWKASSGSTYENSTINGKSQILSIALGGVGSPASLPTALVGMSNFSIGAPEPATIALGLMGASALFIRRRKA